MGPRILEATIPPQQLEGGWHGRRIWGVVGLAASVGTQWSRPRTGIKPTAKENVAQPACREGGLRLVFWPPAKCPRGCQNRKDRPESGVLRPEGAVTQSPGDTGAIGSGYPE